MNYGPQSSHYNAAEESFYYFIERTLLREKTHHILSMTVVVYLVSMASLDSYLTTAMVTILLSATLIRIGTFTSALRVCLRVLL